MVMSDNKLHEFDMIVLATTFGSYTGSWVLCDAFANIKADLLVVYAT